MSAPAAARVGRFNTSTRRHPWVLGKVADWKIPLGPYTPAQLAVAVGGGLLLVKTISWWSWMGPVPIEAWVLTVWAVRRPKIKGRAPLQAALGWVHLAGQPQGSRIGGRAAGDRISRPLLGGFTLEEAAPAVPVMDGPRVEEPAADRTDRRGSAARRSARPCPQPKARPVPVGPVSGVQQLLALAEQAGVRGEGTSRPSDPEWFKVGNFRGWLQVRHAFHMIRHRKDVTSGERPRVRASARFVLSGPRALGARST